MKGFLSLVLVSIALLQMTAAAPTVSERSQGSSVDIVFVCFTHLIDDVAVKTREGEQSMSQLVYSICARLTKMSTTQITRSAAGCGSSVRFDSPVCSCPV
ncbi:hypothetical protein BDR03DRAFT_954729 [Suillus americanus]|nr:hypothetical protein BDR03DRAFT_954729 [Suillus americanus]